jgi:cytochrome c
MRAPVIALMSILVLAACDDGVRQRAASTTSRGAVGVPERFGTIGRVATAAEVQAWDIDVNPTGKGLPAGHGTPNAGAPIFAAKCAACHGLHGEGLGTYPRLIGRDPRDGFPFGQDPKLVKTVGNYWPYSTTLYDYVRRAMPLTAPGSLSSGEVYDVVAYLLAENEIIPRDAVMDARTLPAVKMPARNRFVRDNRSGGAGFR